MEDIETLFQKHKDDVYRLALSYTRSTEEAEDVCQTVFLKAIGAAVRGYELSIRKGEAALIEVE